MKRMAQSVLLMLFAFLLYIPASLALSAEAVPIEIGSIEDLQRIGLDPEYPLNGYYVLTQDIEAFNTKEWDNGAGFLPIGTGFEEETAENFRGKVFSGYFDGQGYVVRNLYINRPNDNGIGLFRTIAAAGAVINVRLEGGSIRGAHYVGSLAGGSRSPSVFGCSAEVAVSGISRIGGLMGLNRGVIDASYATGSITGDYYVGGLVGRNYNGTVQECYATGTVSGLWAAGGLVGGTHEAEVIASFWDMLTSGISVSAGGSGATTDVLKSRNTFVAAGWDFKNIWTILPGREYPQLMY
jgi:hypothetical protein